MFQRQPVQEFHGDKRLTVLVINFIDGADVWVIESGPSFGFALETDQSLRVFGHFIGQELEGHKRPSLTSSAL